MSKLKKGALLFSAACLLLALPFVAFGAADKISETISVGPGELFDGNFVRVGKNIDIEGTVNGDAILIGNNIVVSGQVFGDVIALGENIVVSGDIAGNVRVAGGTVNISGRVARNANLFGAAVIVGDGAEIGKDLLFGGRQAEISGIVRRDIKGMANDVVLSAAADGNVDLKIGSDAGQLILLPEAKVKGNLTYESLQKADEREGFAAQGAVSHKIPEISKVMSGIPFWLGKLISWLGLLAAGAVVIFMAGKSVSAVGAKMKEKPLASIGWGAVCFIVTPLALIVLMLTVIGAPLALMGMAAYMSSLYLAKVFTGIIIGKKLKETNWKEMFSRKKSAPKNKKENTLPMINDLALGVTVFVALTAIPFVGGLISLLGVWWALGGAAKAAWPAKKQKAGKAEA